jgi:hypothetical protein
MNEYLESFIELETKNRYNLGPERDVLVAKYAWAIPNDQAIAELSRYSPLIEIGAGLGFWAYLINQAGGDIVAYDNRPGLAWNLQYNEDASDDEKEHKEYLLKLVQPKSWFNVKVGSFEKLKSHPKRTLFLCWPPYKERLALDCLNSYKGNNLIYVGEWYGCTGCNEFHELLEESWDVIKEIYIPRFYGLNDAMYVLKRKNK